ncbi:hypothetical protein CR194_06715 [Salipaludibacillus keqinensis]|uniref:Glutaredoxin domain-containing protein n=1 Tax=Salipaludibacillus keqinensis TaxID=2045207 RepID=A0A323TJC3_9BACI|nr:glutaredoxin [Salipaludibacillus keqinensis]PYZ95202.1 hypothetical protein CR194_06715 [Salipaludibacillus keqinensis]
MNKPILYTITGCSHCQLAKKKLESIGMKYIEKNILHDFTSAQELMKIRGEITTPMLVFDGKITLNYCEIHSVEHVRANWCFSL